MFQQRVQSGEFSFENLPAMRSVSPMINWKNECLPGAVQIRFRSEPSRRGARCLGRALFEVNRCFQCLCSELHPIDFLSKTARRMIAQSAYVTLKNESLQGAVQIRFSAGPPGEERGV